jgi:diguanylate cyclase (GGDEF)-like protein/PAS domain S-box-containing protein
VVQHALRAGAVSLLALLALAWLIRRLSARIQAPVQALAAVVHGISAGQRGLRAQPQGPAELVEVATGFNRLMDERLQAEAALQAQQRELLAAQGMRDEALRVAQLGMWRVDVESGRMHCDAHLCRLLGVDAAHGADTALRPWLAQLHRQDWAAQRSAVFDCMRGKTAAFDCVVRMRHPARGWVWGRWRGQVLVRLARGGGVLSLLGSFQDISQDRAQADQLRLAASVFTHAREGITITDPQGSILAVNDSFTQITGYAAHEVLGQNPRMLQSGVQGPEFYQALWAQLQECGHWSGEIWNRRKGGEHYVETLTISAVRDPQGQLLHYVGMFTDITRQRESERLLAHAAHYDALSGLPNRTLLTDRLAQAMHQCQRRACDLAVVYLDLDGFGAFNEQFGHERGDALLLTVAQRLKEVLREGDTLARIGGDEFVAVLVDLPRGGDCLPVLQRLLQAATVDADAIRITASMGVTFYPDDPVEAEVLLRHADQAMFVAKQAGRNRLHWFDRAHDAAVRTRHESLEGVRRALDQGELRLHYQPKVHMRSGAVVGCEALIRWQHPQQGLLYPGAFLPTIENQPISIAMGEWVIATALEQLAQWCAQGQRLVLSVNVSAYQLMQSDFEQRLGALLGGQPQVPAGLLEIEVLETSALDDVEHVASVMQRCRGLGVRFALDDFGTGYSSLTYLKRLPAECIKIDQSFVRDMLHDSEDLAIVKGVIGLAGAFHREVIAEGVETTAHGTALLGLGCEHAQGWGIARAMPAESWAQWVRDWSPPQEWQER